MAHSKDGGHLEGLYHLGISRLHSQLIIGRNCAVYFGSRSTGPVKPSCNEEEVNRKENEKENHQP